jgi:ubiquitin-protein ligase
VAVSRSSIASLLSAHSSAAAMFTKAAQAASKSVFTQSAADNPLFIELQSLAEKVQAATLVCGATLSQWAKNLTGEVSAKVFRLAFVSDTPPQPTAATSATSTVAASGTAVASATGTVSVNGAAAGAGVESSSPFGSEEDGNGDSDDMLAAGGSATIDDAAFKYQQGARNSYTVRESKHPKRLPPATVDMIVHKFDEVYKSSAVKPTPDFVPVAGEHLPDPVLTGCATGTKPLRFEPDAESKAKYIKVIKREAFSTMEGLAKEHVLHGAEYHAGEYSHSRKSKGSGIGNTANNRIMRVTAEMAELPETSVEWASSILVRTDEAQMDLMRAFIVGPPDTPYANGWFGFDIKLPATYPEQSPMVEFLTTAGGTCRFNPNLYADGKVCLSLLGTWSGPGWVPNESTLRQVLVSIQSLILVDVPYANEPSYERFLAKAEGKRAVMTQNMHLRLATMRHAMIDVIKKPPTGFETAVQAHFFYKKEEILAQCSAWLEEAKLVAEHEDLLRRRWAAANLAIRAAIELERESYNAYARWMNDTQISSHTVFTAERGRGRSAKKEMNPFAILDVPLPEGAVTAATSGKKSASRKVASSQPVVTSVVQAGPVAGLAHSQSPATTFGLPQSTVAATMPVQQAVQQVTPGVESGKAMAVENVGVTEQQPATTAAATTVIASTGLEMDAKEVPASNTKPTPDPSAVLMTLASGSKPASTVTVVPENEPPTQTLQSLAATLPTALNGLVQQLIPSMSPLQNLSATISATAALATSMVHGNAAVITSPKSITTILPAVTANAIGFAGADTCAANDAAGSGSVSSGAKVYSDYASQTDEVAAVLSGSSEPFQVFYQTGIAGSNQPIPTPYWEPNFFTSTFNPNITAKEAKARLLRVLCAAKIHPVLLFANTVCTFPGDTEFENDDGLGIPISINIKDLYSQENTLVFIQMIRIALSQYIDNPTSSFAEILKVVPGAVLFVITGANPGDDPVDYKPVKLGRMLLERVARSNAVLSAENLFATGVVPSQLPLEGVPVKDISVLPRPKLVAALVANYLVHANGHALVTVQDLQKEAVAGYSAQKAVGASIAVPPAYGLQSSGATSNPFGAFGSAASAAAYPGLPQVGGPASYYPSPASTAKSAANAATIVASDVFATVLDTHEESLASLEPSRLSSMRIYKEMQEALALLETTMAALTEPDDDDFDL